VHIDLHQVEFEILQLLGILVGSLVLWLLQRALVWVGIRLKADRQAQLASVVDKVMTWGVTKADDIIRKRGWDHVESKNAVIMDYALPRIQVRFKETLASAGIDLDNQQHRIQLIDMMERMWPDLATRLSASPATPPAPVVPVVVVPPAARRKSV
jgi:hypothetical protein